MKTLAILAILLLSGALSAATVHLDWQDNSDNELGFKIERSIDGGEFIEIATVGKDVDNFDDDEAVADVVNSYQVRAYNQFGNSEYTNVASRKPISLPGTPSTLTTIQIVEDEEQ